MQDLVREADRGAVGGVRVRGKFSSPSLVPFFVGAMELDRMVIGGDWEEIVLAAAQFKGGTTPQDEDTRGRRKRSQHDQETGRR